MGLLDFLFGKPPPAVDYAAQALAQGQANKDTAVAQARLNNPNIYNPYGSQVYSGPDDGSGRGTLTQTLSPAEQAKLDAQNQAQLGLAGILNKSIPNIDKVLSSPFGLSGSAVEGYVPGTEPGRAQTSADWASAGPVQKGLDFSGVSGIPRADAGVRDLVSQSMYDQGAHFLDPQFKQQQQQLDSTLANQGIVRNPGDNTAWQNEQDSLERQREGAYGDLRDRSIVAGGNAMQQLFQMGLGAHQQGVSDIGAQGQFANQAQQQSFNDILNAMQASNSGIGLQGQLASNQAGLTNAGRAQNYSEYAQNKTLPLNMITALLSGSQVNNPQYQATTPTSITAPPIMQGAQLQGQANTAASNANAGMMGSLLGGIGQIGAGFAGSAAGSAALASMFSDRRLKSNIKRIGEMPSGLPVYSYTIFGVERTGVMADEAEKLFPEAVIEGPAGFKMVDYARIF
jgi:hypothetical protein